MGVAFRQLAVRRHRHAVERVLVVAPLLRLVQHRARRAELQPVGEPHVHAERAVEVVVHEVPLVQHEVAERVPRPHERAGQPVARRRHAVVVGVVAVLVLHDGDAARVVDGPDVCGVDGRDGRPEIHQVARVVYVEVRYLVGLRVHVLHVRPDVHPLLGAVVRLHARADALIVGVDDDALVVKVVQAGEERGAVVAPARGDVVFLAQRVPVDEVLPVVGRQVILRAVASRERAPELRGGVQPPVRADELLTFRHVAVHVVRQVAQHLRVRLRVGGRLRHALPVEVVVVELAVIRLVILARIGDAVVVLHRARVHPPFHVDADLGVPLPAFLRGDQYHPGRAPRPVKGGRGRVLQNRHRFDVPGGDGRQRAGVRRPVEDDERVDGGVHRRDAADVDRARARARLSRGAPHLKSRHRPHQRLRHVRGDVPRDVFRVDYRGGARERRPLLRAVCHHHHLFELLVVLV